MTGRRGTSLVLLLLLIITVIQVKGDAFNFEWTPTQVFGAVDLETKGDNLAFAQDFILLYGSVVVADADGRRLVSFENKAYNSSVTSITAYDSIYTDPYEGIYSIAQTNSSVIIGLTSSTKTSSSAGTIDFGDNEPYDLPFEGVRGITWNPTNNNLYISDSGNSRVLIYTAPQLTLGSPGGVYGQSSTTAKTNPSSPSASVISVPQPVRFCGSSAWIPDSGFSRILRYPVGSTIPDLVWGQPNFTTSTSSTTQTGFTIVYDIAFTSDCSVAFVADFSRILRFRAPFYSNQPAEGVLGASSFTTLGGGTDAALFDRIFRIQFKDYGNNSGMLYILDANNRIVSGITQYSNLSSISTTATPTTSPSTSSRASNSGVPSASAFASLSASAALSSSVASNSASPAAGSNSAIASQIPPSLVPSYTSAVSLSASSTVGGLSESLSAESESESNSPFPFDTTGSASRLSNSAWSVFLHQLLF